MFLIKFFIYAIYKHYYSINNAIEGIIHAARTQSHIRLHLFATCILLLICFTLGIKTNEFMLLTILAAIVVVSEMLNSAIEVTVDIASPHHSELARIAKDIAAGAVLIAACVALIVGIFIFYPYVQTFYKEGIVIASHGFLELFLGSMIIVLIAVIMIKAYVGNGHPLRGGMPSGHASLAFTLWVNLVYIFQNPIVTGVSLAGAVILSVSRVTRKIHSPYEIFVGISLGTLITWMLYTVFYHPAMN
jgi:diacylglycerol kinase (ATP)